MTSAEVVAPAPYQVIALDIRCPSFPKRWTGHKQYGGSIDEVGHWGLQYAQVVMGTVGILLIDILMNVDEC
jgi:hypothetical protein